MCHYNNVFYIRVKLVKMNANDRKLLLALFMLLKSFNSTRKSTQ